MVGDGIAEVRPMGGVYNVIYNDYKVALSIYVPGAGWWPKPTFAHPWTNISSDGTWHNEVVTGGNDQNLTGVMAELVKGLAKWPPRADEIVANDVIHKPAELSEANPTVLCGGMVHVLLDAKYRDVPEEYMPDRNVEALLLR